MSQPLIRHSRLNEPGGVRLSVLFTALAPLTNLDQIGVLQQAIWAMSDEVLLYWFSLCYGAQGYRGADALRVLFGVEMISPP